MMEKLAARWDQVVELWVWFWLERTHDLIVPAAVLLALILGLSFWGGLFRVPNSPSLGRILGIGLVVLICAILAFRVLFGVILFYPGFAAEPPVVLWLLLLFPVILFYFLKLRRSRQPIPSLSLWQSVINDQRVNSPFQRFKRSVLLWLQLLIVLLLVLGAMQPFLPAGAERSEYLPVIIDVSASMAATDQETGKSRLELAKARVRELIGNLLPGQRVALIAMHSTAHRLTVFTDNKRVLLDALDKVKVHDVPSRLEDALRMTQALARTVPIADVVVYSDGNFPERVDFELPFEINYQRLPQGGPNLAITEFNARQGTPPEWSVFIRVESTADASGRVVLLQDGVSLGEESFVLSAGESQRLVFDVDSEVTTNLEARLIPEAGAYDSLASDNVAYLKTPPARNLRVFVEPGMDSFRHALRDNETIDLFPAEGQPVDRTLQYDLAITDNPKSLQAGSSSAGDADDEDGDSADPSPPASFSIDASVRLFVGFIPPDLTDVLSQETQQTEVVDWDRSAPLLQHIQLREVQINDDIQQVPDLPEGYFEDKRYETLVHGRNGPLILQKRIGSDLNIHMLFHTDRSTLPYRVAFPILVLNAVQVAYHEAAMGEVRGATTRVLPPQELSSEREYTVTLPDGKSVQAKSDEAGILSGIPAPLVGRYDVKEDGKQVGSVLVSLLNAGESSLKAVERIQFDELTVDAAEQLLDTDRPMWMWLAAAAFVILLVEWWFYQRRPVIPQAQT